jgi:hypothetical protein
VFEVLHAVLHWSNADQSYFAKTVLNLEMIAKLIITGIYLYREINDYLRG